MIVQWGSCLSNVFFVTNWVRQGGILSTMLFNIYIDGPQQYSKINQLSEVLLVEFVSIICYMQMTNVLLVCLQQVCINYLYNVMIIVENILSFSM